MIIDQSDDFRQSFYKIEEEESEPEVVELNLEINNQLTKNFLIRGKYILTNCKSGILVIDCQRAFERIVYDELINKFISNPISSQKLLFPLER